MAKEEEKKVTVNFKMEQDLHNKVKAAAKKKGISFAGYIRMICIQAIEAEEASK